MGGLMTARRFRTLVLGLTAALAAAACAPGGSQSTSTTLAKDQVLRVNIDTEPKTLDPELTQYSYEAPVDRNLFQTLLTSKPDSSGNVNDVQGGAADKWDVSSDGLTWTFHLRKNSWSDGQPVTAKDFVTGWQRILDPTLAAPYADPFFDTTVAGGQDYQNLDPGKDAAKIPAYVKALGLSAPADDTFVVKLQQPTPYFKWIAALWVGAPVRSDIIQKYGSDKWAAIDTNATKTLVSNGPFMLSELVPQDHLAVVPNPHWTGQKPTLTKITYYYISDTNQAFSRFKTGDLEDQTVPLSDTVAVRNDPVLKKDIVSKKDLTVFWVGFNDRVKPFDNPKVRMAFTQSIDRQKLSDATGGRLGPFSTFIPEGMPGFDKNLANVQKFDATAAKQLLKDSGVDLNNIKVSFLNRNIPDNTQISQILQQQWKDNLGVNVTIDTQESKSVSKLQTAGTYQFSLQGWGADYPDPQDWYDIWFCGSGNQFSGYCNKNYDDLVKKADVTTDQATRLSMYQQAQKILLEDAPGGILYQRNSMELVQPWVKGLVKTTLDDTPPIGDYFYTNVSIAQH
jgi:oligopeptide transport system substrate-binding protein